MPVPISELDMNIPIAPILAKPIEMLYAFLPGRFNAFEFKRPCNLPKAVKEPVNVIPPMNVPKKIAVL